jgi:hypothetical protein
MKSLIWLLGYMLQDCGMQCGTSTLLDHRKMVKRIESEGISFLTISLPAFCQNFESCLAKGSVGSTDFVGYAKSGCLPKLLSGFTTKIFDSGSGLLLKDPSVECIRSIRQICLMWKKIVLPCAERRVKDTFDDFLKCELELDGQVERLPEQYLYCFERISRLVWSSLPELDTLSSSSSVLPRHGPGATAERISGNQKYDLRTWHERLEPFFPFSSYGLTNLNYVEKTEEVEFYEPSREPPTRIITVPKTMKGPRIIAIEPVCMQYTQQALMRFLLDSFARSRWISGQVNFNDQSINQQLAIQGSKDGSFATLDLKEASDRVSRDLVERMLRSRPDLLGPIMACTSTKSKLPSGYVLAQKKFASMGSALCFPIESMVFYIMCLTGILIGLNKPLRPSEIYKISRKVFVFGDDLIIPGDYVPLVRRTLSLFSMKVNERKSFWTGKFRESCGEDSYDGQRVTPTYVRRLYPSSKRDATSLVSWVSFCNQLYSNGYWLTAKALRNRMNNDFGRFPVVSKTSSVLGWHSFTNSYESQRWNSSLHRYEVKGLTIVCRKTNDNIDSHARLLRFFLNAGPRKELRNSAASFAKTFAELTRSDSVDFERTVSVTLKTRWATGY